ncbi:MAG TPA: protein kinase, partial [Urbifossiella sp.]|nr:protein kinase [Urbifossiella sp.]
MTEETLFAAALDRADPAERAAFLADACPDPAARRRVEDLLAAHAAAGSFLDHPALGGEPTRSTPPTDPDATATLGGGRGIPADEVLAFLQPPTRPGAIGRLAHYEVLEVLGSGGFGTVLKAFDDRLHRVVAVKMLAPQLAASGPARARFQRESRSAAAVHDEHVVNVHAVSDEDAPVPYLVMEFVAGQTLQQKLEKAGPLPPKEVLRVGSQVARGLAAAHATGLIHRDIKPANVLLENGVERVKITDFGLARTADDASISRSGVVVGTPMFMSPEQARGDALDTRSDLFSLGSVLYALCTGRPPFRADSAIAVLKRVIDDAPRPVREVNPEVPRWLADVVAKLHAKNPADRFQTAREVADLLAGYLAEYQQQGTVTPQAGVALPSRPRWKKRWVAAAAAACAALAPLVWAGPFLARYAGKVAAVDVEPADGLVSVGIEQDDGPVLSRYTQPGTRLIVLPGRYRLTANTPPPHWAATQWSVTTHGPFGSRTETYSDPVAVLDVPRGSRVTVRAVRRGDPETHAPGPKTDPAPPAAEWVPLFNGKALTGWKNHPDQPGGWKVEGGELVGRGRMALLYSDRGDYRDYDLRVEAKVNKGGYGGVFVRTPDFPQIRTQVFDDPKGHRVVLAAESPSEPRFTTGSLKTWRPKGHMVQAWTAGPPPDEWFTLDVLARGPELTVRVNGKRTAFIGKVAEPEHEVGSKGFLVLEAQGDDTVIHVRRIEIRELPTAAPPPAAAPFTAAEAKAHQEAWAEHLGVPVAFEGANGIAFRLIPPGEFGMGLADAELAAFREELKGLPYVGEFQRFAAESSGPRHSVRITRPFYLAARETTAAQFRR